MCVYPSFRTRPPGVFGSRTWKHPAPTAQFGTHVDSHSAPRHTILAVPRGYDATANVRCYDYPAKEVLVKVLGYLLARLGIRLIWAVVEFVANWSLDTVNTNPLTRTARARPEVAFGISCNKRPA